jgi:hypothetical protein
MVEEARTEQIAPPGIENHAVAGLRPDVNMRVDETWNDQVASRVDHRVGGTVIVLPHVADGVAVKSDLPVPQDTVLTGLVGDDPFAFDQRAGETDGGASMGPTFLNRVSKNPSQLRIFSRSVRPVYSVRNNPRRCNSGTTLRQNCSNIPGNIVGVSTKPSHTPDSNISCR